MNFTNDEACHTKNILFKSLKQISQIAAGHWIENLISFIIISILLIAIGLKDELQARKQIWQKNSSLHICTSKDLYFQIVLWLDLPISISAMFLYDRRKVQSITTPTTFSNLLNFTLNYWIISPCCLSSIIWAFSVSPSLTLQIVEPYLFILQVF